MRGPISVEQLLEVVGALDDGRGATVREVVWELEVELEQLLDAYRRARQEGLIRTAPRRAGDGEERWRLTPGGWAAVTERRQAAG